MLLKSSEAQAVLIGYRVGQYGYFNSDLKYILQRENDRERKKELNH